MPQRRRATFRAPGAIDPALLAEGAEATVDGDGEGDSFEHAVEPVGTREDSAAPDTAEPSRPAKARRGFVVAMRGRDASAGAAASPDAAPADPEAPDAGTPQGPGSVPRNPGPPTSRRHGDGAVGPADGPARPTTAGTAATPDPPGTDPGDRHPRHRADHARNRRPSSGARRLVALGATTALFGVTAFGAVASAIAPDGSAIAVTAGGVPGSTSTVRAASPEAAAARDEIVSTAALADERPTITSGLSTASVPFTGGTKVTVTGEGLDQVGGVTVAGTAATIVAADESTVTFAVPATSADSLGGVEVSFSDAAGNPVPVEASAASVAAGVDVPSASTSDLSGIVEASTNEAPTALTLNYTTDPRIDAQVGYVLAHWSDYNSDAYTVLSGVDCANFTSQSLIARGWKMNDGWYYDHATGAMSPSWASSTALRDYLLGRTDLATALDDSQRGLVKVGDIAQFDWDDSGDRDHTAVVTRVVHSGGTTRIWVGGHTKDADYWDVDEALASGGSVTYFSLK